MERNTENKVLSFSKGMTTMPSDLLCEDSELAECRSLIYSSGEVKPIQKAVSIGAVDSAYTIKYVHKMADYENIICYDGSSSVCWYSRNENGTIGSMQQSFNVGEAYNITSVGNTLVVSTADGLHYALFKGGKYKDLGTELPKPEFVPYLKLGKESQTYHAQSLKDIVDNVECRCDYDAAGNICSVTYPAIFYHDDTYTKVTRTKKITNETATSGKDYYGYFSKKSKPEDDTDLQTAIKATVSEGISYLKEKNFFLFPFYVRCALRMFDGTYCRISQPIILYPSVRNNNFVGPVDSETGTYGYSADGVFSGYHSSYTLVDYFAYLPAYTQLYFKASIPNADEWSDIIRELVVFATDDVMPFYLDDTWTPRYPSTTYNQSFHDYVSDTYNRQKYIWAEKSRGSVYNVPVTTIEPTFKSDSEIIEELLTKTVFYKLLDIKIDSERLDGNEVCATDIIKKNVVTNLTTQSQLKVDDYYGWTHLVCKILYTYNNRLNVFEINRYPFDGFNLFTGLSSPSTSYKFYVHINSQYVNCWRVSEITSVFANIVATGWLYYPDPNAVEMIVWNTTEKKGFRVLLKEHPYLNGAYSFNNLPADNVLITYDVTEEPAVDTSAYESLDSNIYTSVINNPYVFEASGDNTVGTGKILGIAANTEAISQGQFGQYPLFVFTNEGIYAMAVNSEGLFSSIYPVSREVCNNADSITPTDRLVYFTSAKGLMAISGGTVVNVSEQMRGRLSKNFCDLEIGFINFLTNCIIAYDYRDSLLRIFGFNGTTPRDWQYIFNMADKTFSTLHHDMKAIAVVNDYPDNLIQDEDGYIYSLSSKPDINDDTNSYAGTLTTRPLKLGGSITLKSLRKIRHLLDSLDGKMELEIWGSNNTKHWQKLTSLLGKPWAYYTFKYTFSNLKATDAFSGSVVTIQNRRETR